MTSDVTDDDTAAFFTPLGDGRYAPTRHVQGVWRPYEQHMAPVGGLIAHAIDRHEPRPGMALARVSYDILGVMPMAPTEVTVRTLRPGRTIELVEATMSAGGRAVVVARAWRIATGDSARVAGTAFEPMPGPDRMPPSDRHFGAMSGGYVTSLEVRAEPDRQPGRGRTWVRSPYPLVDGEPTTPTASFLRLIDTANGLAPRVGIDEWAFPNVDLTVHLFREPHGDWVGFDTRASFSAQGTGLTSSVLHDVDGPVGTAEQILTVRPMSQM